MKSFHIIVAFDQHRGIGKDNALPWHFPQDMQYFAQTTTATQDTNALNAVIMGRHTWDSISDTYKPLKNRLNIVLSSRDTLSLPEGVLHGRSLDDALDVIERFDKAPIETVFVIGGAQVYKEALQDLRCESLYITQINATFECDVFFPDVSGDWSLRTDSEPLTDLSSGASFSFQTWLRL